MAKLKTKPTIEILTDDDKDTIELLIKGVFDEEALHNLVLHLLNEERLLRAKKKNTNKSR